MTEEQEAYLLEHYPDLYWDRRKLEEDGSVTYDCSPYIWGFDVGEGWFNLIVELSDSLSQLVLEINKKEENNSNLMNFKVCQIKEKFGGLRFNIGPVPEEYSTQVHELISCAELKSFTICEVCGEKGSLRTDIGWIRTLCDKHYLEIDSIKKGRSAKTE